MKMQKTYDELQEMTRNFAPDVRHSNYSTVKDGEGENWIVEFDSFDTILSGGRCQFTRGFGEWFDTVIVENPTVVDALRATQRSIRQLGDFHHVFFEGLEVSDKVDASGTRFIEIVLGS